MARLTTKKQPPARVPVHPAVFFPGSNALSIPALNPQLQLLDAEGHHFIRSSNLPGRPSACWLHYADDWRIERFWKRPQRLYNDYITASLEVNYTVLDEFPLPFALWQIYRKRYLSVWMQHKYNYFIAVDLNVPRRFQAINLAGVPLGWRAYSTRAYADRVEELQYEYDIVYQHSRGNPYLIVYGGGKPAARWCHRNDVYHIEQHSGK